MNTDKLYVELIQEMQDLTRLLEKAESVAIKVNTHVNLMYKVEEKPSEEIAQALQAQTNKLEATLARLGGVIFG